MSAIGRVKTSIPVKRPETASTALFPRIRSTFVTAIVIIAFVGLGITIVGIPWTYMPRIITAAVIVGIIIIERARTYGQVNPSVAVTIFDLNHIIPGAFAEIQKRLPGRRGIGDWSKAP